jgi:putative membrane protein
MHTTPLKLAAAAVAAALTLAACGDDDKSSSDRTASRSGGDAAQTTPRSGASTSSSQSANTPAGTDGVTSGTNPTATGQSGATMSGNVPSNASPGSPAGAAPGATSTLPPQTNSPSPNSPTAVQGNPGSPPTTGSSPAGGSTGRSASATAATGGAASVATTAAAKGDASRNAIGTTEKRFITNAASGGLLEVEAGRVVAQQATSPAVRQLAEKLVRDHETANSELKQLAAAKGVQVPAEMSREDRAMVDKLRKMQGRDLDRAYVEQVGRAHHRKDIEEFERTARESNDPDVRAFAQKQLPILRQHYEMAQQAAGQVTSSSK